MAVLSSTALTLADWARRVDDNYKITTIVEMLSKTNEILTDALFVEGNLPTGHRTTVRTGLPSATWRLLNYGVAKGKSTTAQITDSCGMLETYAEVDKSLADLNGNTAQFRLSESMAFVEGMSQQVADAMIYGDTSVYPERFMGLAPRFNTVSTATAQSAANVIDAGGTGSDNTSIWIVVWGPNTCHGIFPKGSTAGLQHRDLGEWTLSDGAGGQYQGYRDHFKWDVGLTVRDWRYIVRICNIDTSDLIAGTGPDLIEMMIRGIGRLPTTPIGRGPVSMSDGNGIQGEMGRTSIYCNRTVRTWLDIQVLRNTNGLIKLAEYDGKLVSTFRGIPIYTVDAITNAEARIV